MKAAVLATLAIFAIGCGGKPVPEELLGSYTRSGDTPAELRAELSIARGGMVLTLVRLSATADLGAFASLVKTPEGAKTTAGGTIQATAGPARSVASARLFRSIKCDGRSCTFELGAEDGLPACGGTFEKTKDTIVVIGVGPCAPYSGRWVSIDGAPPPVPATAPPSSPAPSSAIAPSALPKLDFPPDVPAPHDHMSCLQACSIMDTRCHRTSQSTDRSAFLACVEQHQVCRARCEQVYPFLK